MSNAFRNTRIEFHILQSFPVTCLNRDDVGAPKTAVVGGVTRARVSSQCWKRQVRLALPDCGVTLATRTKQVAKLLEQACLTAGANEEQAKACADAIAALLIGSKTSSSTGDDSEGGSLLFISNSEVKAFAEFAAAKSFDVSAFKGKGKGKGKETDKETDKEKEKEKDKSKELAKLAKKTLNPAIDALDIALFGRMVAKAADMNVEAAASFSHAISTHRVSNEVEFFTALDDMSKDEPGSAHMGSLEFNSATYYRYISLDVGQLAQSLGPEDLAQAVAAFTKALFEAVPAARQTTQSGASPWEFARVLVRKGQRLQVPFETAVKARDGGFLQPSIQELKSYLDKKEKLSGSLFGKIAGYDWGENENFSIDELISALQRHVQ